MDDTALLLEWELEKIASGSTAKSIKERLITIRAGLRRTGRTLMTMQRPDLIADLARPGISSSTRGHYRSVYRNIFDWMQDERYRPDNPAARLPQVRVPRTEPNPFTAQDVQRLLDSGIYRRARLWVLLYAYQGFRASEIAAVAGETIDWDARTIFSKDGKAGKEVWRPIHPIVWDELQKWNRTGHLFPSPVKPGEHVSGNNVSRVLSDAMKRAGIHGHRPHQMRAFFATEMIRAGASTATVAAALRHSDLQSVTKYVAIDQEAVGEAMATIPVVRIPARSGRTRRDRETVVPR